jgi:hypothetical protein
VFIAYATDAGSVALEGDGEHSPFTKALLKNLKKPISIDDMFSLVTREVSLVTKGMQRPYKYASLENIVCLADTCADSSAPVANDVIQEVKRAEGDELQIALQTANVDALISYLEKYPKSAERPSVLAEISRLKRSEFNEWTLYEIVGEAPQYFKMAWIRQFGEKVAVQIRFMADPERPLIGTTKFPLGTYAETTTVYDCQASTIALADIKAVSAAGETLGSYAWADPEALNPILASKIQPGTLQDTEKNIFCDEQLRTPLVTKKQLASMSFLHLASTTDGKGEMYYTALQGAGGPQNEREAIVVSRLVNEEKVANWRPPQLSKLEVGTFKTAVYWDRIKCVERKFLALKTELYDASNGLSYLSALNQSMILPWSDIREASPLASLHSILCTPQQVRK